jgi:hypothetical protein
MDFLQFKIWQLFLAVGCIKESLYMSPHRNPSGLYFGICSALPCSSFAIFQEKKQVDSIFKDHPQFSISRYFEEELAF